MKLIFLDRDGVINKDPNMGYVTKWEEFYFLPGALEALAKLNRAGYEINIISNQAGVAKGLMSESDLNEITENMLKRIEDAGGRIRSVHYCIHRKEDNCDCRKPKTGLFRKATAGLDVNFRDTFFIGDKLDDIVAGKALGMKTILLLSGLTDLNTRAGWQTEPDYIMQDLTEAVEWLMKCGK